MLRRSIFGFRPQLARSFTSSTARFISVGDSLPNKPLFENSPGNAVNIVEEIGSSKAVIVGVPGAFSPACSASHVPGFLKHLGDFKKKGYEKVYVVGVNDPFVFKAWGEQLDSAGKLRYLADSTGEFSSALDLTFDATKAFGNHRSKRFAMLVDDGKVVKLFVEPDNVSVDASSAENVLAGI